MRGALPVAASEGWDAEAWAIVQVETAPVPALVARADGTLLAANAHADLMIGVDGPTPPLRALIEGAWRADKMQVARLALQGSETGTQSRRFDLSLLPLPDAIVLVVARETTLEANMLAALTASRELFRDLVSCATDFAFETDASGVFTWVSPGGALGFSATDLHGAHPRGVFGDVDGIKTFSARQPVSGQEIWCASKEGGDCCVALTVVPTKDAGGNWRGTRGVARDVTALRLHERASETARRRDELIAAIVGAVRGQIETRRMMLAAAEALLVATQSDCVTIRPTRLATFARIGDVRADAPHHLDLTTSYQNQTNGTVQLSRNAEAAPFGKAEASLLEAVVPHLGIAIALVESFAPGAPQAQHDDLTGLFASHGFDVEGQRRLGALARAGRSCAVVLFECGAPDRSVSSDDLRALGRLLAGCVKAGDVVARLAGASFALLVETDSAALVSEKIEDLIEDRAALGALSDASGDDQAYAGIAFSDSQAGEPLDELLARAGLALAQAKREGRRRVVVAEPMKKVMPC